MNVTLREVDADNSNDLVFLYKLLEERRPDENISHKTTPTWREHCKFVESRPYLTWRLIFPVLRVEPVGAIYLSRQNEIGIWVLLDERQHGYAEAAVRALIEECEGKRLLANINPANGKSIALFEKLGFRLVQHTYARE